MNSASAFRNITGTEDGTEKEGNLKGFIAIGSARNPILPESVKANL